MKAGEKAKVVGKGENVSSTISKVDSDLVKKYIRDIEGRTGRELPKNQIEKLKEALRNKEYQKLSPLETRKHRREFNKAKDKLIDEWEINTVQKWPTYSKDVISEKTGEPIRRKGDKFDAHHIIENCFQGNMNGGIYILQNFRMNINQVFMVLDHQQMNYLKEVNNK